MVADLQQNVADLQCRNINFLFWPNYKSFLNSLKYNDIILLKIKKNSKKLCSLPEILKHTKSADQ